MKHKYFLTAAMLFFLMSPFGNAVAKDSIVLAKSVRELIVPVTAYSSTVDQTDDTPFIAANGTYVHDGVVAANFLPFGTKIKIPEKFGDKIFVVEDRMHRRHVQRVDIWFPNRASALRFGYQELKIQILEN
jgi:3D (Asp-Asp-Asp) domain-containing protein